MELLKVDRLEEALDKLNRHASLPETEIIDITESYGRVLAKDIISPENTPAFNRSTVDGYAVISSDTSGAGEMIPAFLTIVGEVEMGKPALQSLKRGECMYVPTGGMLPENADAMVMVENTETFGDDRAAIYEAVSYGKNCVFAGDDCGKGDIVLKSGRKIRAYDMGMLSSIGISEVEVYMPWDVYIISTGDELVDTDELPGPGQVRDINTYGLMGLCDRYGFNVTGYSVVKDSEDDLREAICFAMKAADIVAVSGGSSQGKKDKTKQMVDELTSTGAFTHGIAIKPGKPTIIGYDEPSNTVVIGLPGHPVGALVLFEQLVGALWERKTGLELTEIKPELKGIMGANIAAAPGRKTIQLVRVERDELSDTIEGGLPKIYPVLGKSVLITTLTEADGYVTMDVDDEGLNQGDIVKVRLI